MQHSGSNRKTRAHQNKRGKQLTPASICADGGKLVDTSIAAELRLLPEGLTECPALQLPFLLSYELLRESQSFTRILAEKNANEGWCINFLGWDMPGLKSPYSFDRLFEYYPAPWLDLPSYERARFGCETSALPIRGEDLLDLILNTCFKIDIESDERQFPPIGVRGLDEGGANEGMYSMVPKLQYGIEAHDGTPYADDSFSIVLISLHAAHRVFFGGSMSNCPRRRKSVKGLPPILLTP